MSYKIVLTHIDGRDPISKSTHRASRLCRSHFSTAMATINPPMRSQLVSFKYVTATSLADSTPVTGKRIRGRREVTTSGKASVIQYTAMMKMM